MQEDIKVQRINAAINIDCSAGTAAMQAPAPMDGGGMELTSELRDVREKLRLEMLQRKRLQQIMIAKTQEARAAVSAWRLL